MIRPISAIAHFNSPFGPRCSCSAGSIPDQSFRVIPLVSRYTRLVGDPPIRLPMTKSSSYPSFSTHRT